MKTYAVIEIEEGALTLTVGGRRGRSLHVTRCERHPLLDSSRDSVAGVLGSLDAVPLREAEGVHVVLGDRRASHFVTPVPWMKPEEVVQFVAREGLRISGLPGRDDLLLAVHLLRREHRRLVVAASTLPASVWQPLRAGFEARGVEVAGLHTMESCLALAAPAGHGESAVLEVSSGRARFVVSDGGSPHQVRRFILGGGGSETSTEAVLMQLALELPRTLDWLRESGVKPPRRLVVGSRLHLDDETVEMLRGDLEELAPATVERELDAGQAEPGLASLMLLQRLLHGEAPPSLLAEPSIRLPWGAGRMAALAAVALVGVACSWHALGDDRARRTALEEATAFDGERLALEQRLVALTATAAPLAEPRSGDAPLQRALRQRRPISRLVADVSNSADDDIELELLQFASDARVELTGVVRGASRTQALEVLAAFVDRVRALPYLQPDGEDEVSDVPARASCLRFRLVLSWRHS